MKNNPLAIFIGLALLTVLALAGVTKDRWYPGEPRKEALAPSAPAEAQPAQPAAEAPPPPAIQEATAPAAEMPAAAPAKPAAAPPSQPEAAAEVAAAAPAEPAATAPTQPEATAKVAAAAPAEAAATPQSQPEVAAEVAAAAPAEPAATPPAQPDATAAAPQSAAAEAPGFDTVRIEKTGEAVIAGRAVAGSEVVIKLNGQPIGSATSNQDGNFVVVPEQPLPPGAAALTLEVKPAGAGAFMSAGETLAVAVPEQPQQEAMAALVSPDQPTQVLQTPEVAATPEAPEAAAAQPETTPLLEAPAAPATAVSLDVVDYDDRGNIIFSGRAAAGAAVRLYVDNAAVGEARSGADGRWNFAGTAQIAPGNHTLRADQIDAAGAVASRIELPFFREEAARVAAVVPEAPAVTAPAAQPEAPAATAPAAQPEAPAATAPAVQPEAPAAAAPAAQPEVPAAAAPAAQPEAPAAEAPAAKTQVATVAAAGPQPREGRIVIQPGNNLWRISRVVYGSGVKYTVIYEANKDHIRHPDLIYPGQIFTTPDVVPPERIDPKRRAPLTPEEGGAPAQP
ncbi:MAG: LysM peptidoglycan-binding domain-containing protein [Hyphomicrobiales bacterium]